MNKKLSIIIASYNEANYIKDCIESCLGQKTNFEYEIIIGDDGSNDGSQKIIDSYVEKYPNKIVKFEMDRSGVTKDNLIGSIRVSNLLKEGFALSSGNYLKIISADDYLLSDNVFQTDVDFLDNNANYISCFSDYEMIWEDGKIVKKQYSKNLKNNRDFWMNAYVHISCFSFRRAALNNLLDRYCDDIGMCYSLLVTGKTKYISYISFAYRQRSNSIMHSKDKNLPYIGEVMLLQDVINNGEMVVTSIAKFHGSVDYILKNRKEFKNKYKIYIDNSFLYENNLLNSLINFDEQPSRKKIRIYMLLFIGKVIWMYKRTISNMFHI